VIAMPANEPHMLSAALFYAGARINVFPVGDHKRPLVEHGFHEATTDRTQIETWWTRWPTAAIGTPDFDVVDADTYKPGGPEDWKRIQALIPAGTPKQKTPRGGLQLFFAAGSLKGRKFADTIDLRYAGRNYVLLPPSRFADHGRYEWVTSILERRPRPAPEFPDSAPRNGPAPAIPDKIPYGRQHYELVSLAGTMRRRGMNADEIFAALWQLNVNRCERPGPEKNIRQIAESVEQYDPSAKFERETKPKGKNTLAWERLSEVEMRSIVFLDKPLWQASAFHLLVGRKGVGKGTALADLAARVTRGELGKRRNVLWIASEDSASIDIKPRVVAAGGDPRRVARVKDWLQLPRDIAKLSATLAEVGNVGLGIIDPVGNHITGKNSNSDTDIRDAIAPLNDLADEHETMIVGVRHLSEKEAKSGAIAAILGASAWAQVPRALIAVARDKTDPSISHIQCLSGNRLPPETSGRVFRIEGVLLEDLENEVTRAVWSGDSTESVEALLSASDRTVAGVPAEDVQRVVLAALVGGEKSRAELDAVCQAELGVSSNSVYKSGLEPLKAMGLIHPRKAGLNGPWYWRLDDGRMPV
jgi:Bifunctional DNA primase/polymerase, N-terminal/AAA domain/Primase C terminal 1 (PriCT-1)